MNVPLLRAVQADLLANPDGFNVDQWDMCIACRAVRLSGGLVPGRTLPDYAEELLQVGTMGGQRLFILEKWPEEFYDRMESAGYLLAAQVAADRIERFIETGGRE